MAHSSLGLNIILQKESFRSLYTYLSGIISGLSIHGMVCRSKIADQYCVGDSKHVLSGSHACCRLGCAKVELVFTQNSHHLDATAPDILCHKDELPALVLTRVIIGDNISKKGGWHVDLCVLVFFGIWSSV